MEFCWSGFYSDHGTLQLERNFKLWLVRFSLPEAPDFKMQVNCLRVTNDMEHDSVASLRPAMNIYVVSKQN